MRFSIVLMEFSPFWVHFAVPISIYILSLPLPYLPDGASLSPYFLFGSLILMLGLVLYNTAQPVKEASKRP